MSFEKLELRRRDGLALNLDADNVGVARVRDGDKIVGATRQRSSLEVPVGEPLRSSTRSATRSGGTKAAR